MFLRLDAAEVLRVSRYFVPPTVQSSADIATMFTSVNGVLHVHTLLRRMHGWAPWRLFRLRQFLS